MHELPDNYKQITKRFKEYGNALDELGRVAKEMGPLDEKTCHIAQLAASAGEQFPNPQVDQHRTSRRAGRSFVGLVDSQASGAAYL